MASPSSPWATLGFSIAHVVSSETEYSSRHAFASRKSIIFAYSHLLAFSLLGKCRSAAVKTRARRKEIPVQIAKS